MKEELCKAVDSCQHCQEDQPTQARPTVDGLLPSSVIQPLLHVATDLFDLNGDTYIVLVDCYSGYAWTEKLRHTDTWSICESPMRSFTDYGWPDFIRTDVGPQFRGEFAEYCSRNGIKHDLALAYDLEPKGLAKAAVKIMKSLLSRCIRVKEDIQMAIAAWRNMARDNGQSPSQLFLRRIQRRRLPLAAGQAKNRSQCIETKDSMSEASTASRNLNTKDYDKLSVGSLSLMQCHLSKKWNKAVKIVAIGMILIFFNMVV